MTRNHLARPAAAAALLLASGLAAAQITLFQQPNFGGGGIPMQGSSPDLKGTVIYDQASSARVAGGRWQLCSQPNFQGDCVTLGPGDYARLEDKIYHRVESVRQLESAVQAEPVRRRDYAMNSADRAPVELYTRPGFRGFSMRIDDSTPRLDPAAEEEGVASLIVREGHWQLCSDRGFNGYCRTFGPGRYPRLGGVDGAQVASMRRIG